MAREPWIRDCGTVQPGQLAELLSKWKAVHPDAPALVSMTDSYLPFAAGKLELTAEQAGKVLEIRTFVPEAELWIHRSSIGSGFAWRIADTETLKENAAKEKIPFFADWRHYQKEEKQKIDMDLDARPQGSCPEGCRLLQTVGGRTYALPVKDENAVRVVSYFSYDSNGVARQKDFRIAGFAREEMFGKRGND